MLIKIGSKEYNMEKMELVDSISGFNWQEFMYYNENLLKTTDGEYILETNFRLNPQYYADDIEKGFLSEEDLQPQKRYRALSEQEADAWLEESIWQV